MNPKAELDVCSTRPERSQRVYQACLSLSNIAIITCYGARRDDQAICHVAEARPLQQVETHLVHTLLAKRTIPDARVTARTDRRVVPSE